MFFHHRAQLMAKPVGGKPELAEGVVMGAFVLQGLFGGPGNLRGGFGAEGNPEVPVDGTNRFGSSGNQITVKNPQVA